MAGILVVQSSYHCLPQAGFDPGSPASRVVDHTTVFPWQLDQKCADKRRACATRRLSTVSRCPGGGDGGARWWRECATQRLNRGRGSDYLLSGRGESSKPMAAWVVRYSSFACLSFWHDSDTNASHWLTRSRSCIEIKIQQIAPEFEVKGPGLLMQAGLRDFSPNPAIFKIPRRYPAASGRAGYETA